MIFQDGGRRHFGFSKIRNFNNRSAVWVHYASLYQNSSKSVKGLQRYGGLTVFSKWRPSAILDLLGADWDHPRRLVDGLYRCAKFGWNRCSSFDNMKLSIFCPFGLKTPIQAPKIGVLGGFHPQNGGQCQTKTPKRHILARVRVVWTIKRENPSSRLTCRWVDEKKVWIKKNCYILPICPEAPHRRRRICTKFGAAVGTADVITCTNFLVIGQGVFILWGVKNCHLSLTKPVTVNTGLALPRSPWFRLHLLLDTWLFIRRYMVFKILQFYLYISLYLVQSMQSL